MSRKKNGGSNFWRPSTTWPGIEANYVAHCWDGCLAFDTASEQGAEQAVNRILNPVQRRKEAILRKEPTVLSEKESEIPTEIPNPTF